MPQKRLFTECMSEQKLPQAAEGPRKNKGRLPLQRKYGPSQPSTSTAGMNPFPKDLYKESWYRRQHRESANLVDVLKQRETGSRRRISYHKLVRDIYTTLPLSRASVCAEMLNRDHIITWTPDGCRLICYAFHLDAIRVYRYLGVQNSRNAPDLHVLDSLFELDFEVKPHTADGFQIRMDAIYFTACGRFFIVGTSVTIPESMVILDAIFQNNESVPLGSTNVEDLNLLCIDLEAKKIVSEKNFCMDRIPLSTGVNVSGNFLMVTSIQHQIIFILQIHPQTGLMDILKEIGPAVKEEEEVYNQLSYERRHNIRNSYYTGLKQRIATFLYKRAKANGTVTEYLRTSDYHQSLRIEKTYIFEQYYIMIRMLPKDANKETAANPCFFVILDWRDSSIVDIFDEYDDRFLTWVLELAEPLYYPMASSNWVGASNFSYHAHWAMFKSIRRETRHCAESMRRLLNQLPFPTYQPYKISTQSPYLDPTLFHLDPKVAIGIINGKMRAENDDPRFIVVRTRKASFQLSLSVMGAIGLRQVTLLFHPQDPLALAVDRVRSDHSVVVFQPSCEVDSTAKNSPRDPTVVNPSDSTHEPSRTQMGS